MSSATKSTEHTSHPADVPALKPAADLAVARKAIQAILPQHLPIIEGVEVSTLHLPAPELGGSLFDVIPISDELIAFVIFDVNGSGVAAALKSSVAKVSFTNHIRTALSPRAVMNRVCAEMTDNLGESCFAAAFIGYLDLHSNRLTYCNHGYTCSAIFRTKEPEIVFLKTSGTATKRSMDEKNVLLNPGDWFVIYTCGFESFVGNGLSAGSGTDFSESLRNLMHNKGPDECLGHIRNYYQKLPRSKQPGEDVAVVAVQMLTQSRRSLLKQELGFQPIDPVYLQYLSYFEEMDKSIGIVLKAMDNQGYADDTIRKMKITLTELLVNALHHGNKKDPTKKVTMGHMVDKNKTVISILDEGEGFDPSLVPDPTLPENLIKDSGRGLYIVRCYVDELQYNKKGNRVTIFKRGSPRR